MQDNNKNNGAFSHGFMWGLLVGGLIVFLLGTKSGRKILHHLSENGFKALENIEDLEHLDEYSFDEQDDPAPADTRYSNGSTREENEPIYRRRFFKGVKPRI